MFKNSLLVSVGLLTVGPAFAADQIVTQEERRIMGYVEGYFGQRTYDENEETGPIPDREFAGLVGRLNIPVYGSFNVQLDASVDNVFDAIDFDTDDGAQFIRDLRTYAGAAHVYWRDPTWLAIGAFADIRRYESFPSRYVPDLDTYVPIGKTQELDFVGVEGQLFFDRVTFYGQASFGERTRVFFNDEDTDEDSVSAWNVRGVLRYFPWDDTRLQAEVSYGEEKLGFEGFTRNTWRAAAQADYRFSSFPVSVFGRYQFEDPFNEGEDRFGTQPTASHRVLVGARYSFGSNSLLDEDRNGASMDTYVPNFIGR